MRKPQGTIWVCVDCLFMAANGEVEDHDPTQPEPWALWPDGDVTMGDDEMDFSWSPCQGCGSTLGGSRHEFTWWGEDDE